MTVLQKIKCTYTLKVSGTQCFVLALNKRRRGVRGGVDGKKGEGREESRKGEKGSAIEMTFIDCDMF